MNGRVTDELVPIIDIRVFDASGNPLTLPVTVDTGFNGELALPPDVLQGLDSPRTGSRRVRVGDGSWIWVSTHDLELEWDDSRYTVTCIATPSCHLLGMAVLLGYLTCVESRPEGLVSIEPLYGT